MSWRVFNIFNAISQQYTTTETGVEQRFQHLPSKFRPGPLIHPLLGRIPNATRGQKLRRPWVDTIL